MHLLAKKRTDVVGNSSAARRTPVRPKFKLPCCPSASTLDSTSPLTKPTMHRVADCSRWINQRRKLLDYLKSKTPTSTRKWSNA